MASTDQILTAAQMRLAEQALIDGGATVEELMERAGLGAAEWIYRIAAGSPVTILCGPGNNGGDGYVIARELRRRGLAAEVVAPLKPKTPAAIAACRAYDRACVAQPDGAVLVDCLFGTGLTRPLDPALSALLSDLAAHHPKRVAIDVPSGVDSDSGGPLNPRLPTYDLTLALGAWKPAHALLPAVAAMGELKCVPIGITVVAGAAERLVRPRLSPPAADAQKYTRGLVAVVAGEMPGAAALAAEAAARGGAGYVRLLASDRPAGLSHAIVSQQGLDFRRAAAVLAGPGLGRHAEAHERLAAAMTSGVPVVADADALWLLGEHRQDALPPAAIVTPHAGEFAHLFGAASASKLERARDAARRCGSVVVFKGPDTVIAAPDGRARVAPQPPSWLSTAGTGDVLAGLCAARLAVCGDPFAAACEAVWLHAAAARLSGPAFIADDLVRHIPAALADCL